MVGWGSKICVGLCTAALLATPAGAAAIEMPPQGPTAAFTVKGSHGYRVEVSIADGTSTISVDQGRLSLGSANYFSFHGHATTEVAETRLGHIGRVKVRFRPSGEVQRHPAPPCNEGSQVTRSGVFEGTIRFHGEHGYTDVDVQRARGTIITVPRQSCSFSSGPKERNEKTRDTKGPREIIFSASSEAAGVSLSATRMQGAAEQSIVSASTQESREGVVIARQVLQIVPIGSFSFDPELNSATLSPPAPFSGSASFERIDDYASRWEGPLTVSFPGRPDVPLTGRDFSWNLQSRRASNSSTSIIVFGGSAGEDR
jgi:hypothetical protein